MPNIALQYKYTVVTGTFIIKVVFFKADSEKKSLMEVQTTNRGKY